MLIYAWLVIYSYFTELRYAYDEDLPQQTFIWSISLSLSHSALNINYLQVQVAFHFLESGAFITRCDSFWATGYGFWGHARCVTDMRGNGVGHIPSYIHLVNGFIRKKESHSPLAMRRAPAVWHPKRDAPRETGDTCRRSAPAHGYAPVAIHRVALVAAHRQTHPARTCCPYWPGSVWLWAWVGDTS